MDELRELITDVYDMQSQMLVDYSANRADPLVAAMLGRLQAINRLIATHVAQTEV